MELLSLVITVYNTEKFVEKCLQNIFLQTYKNIEVIVVNNGSSGNINEIVEQYRELFPDRTIKLVINETNQGTFHGRGSGMSVAEGDYFAFMDADDRLGVDFFGSMIEKAKASNSEIVVADLVHENEDMYAYRYIVDPVRSITFDLRGNKDVFDFYYRFAGQSYSMYGIWNKIYKRCLWDRCKPYIDAITERFALCEDAVYTTIFFSQAESACNIHNQYYYHFVHSSSASANMAENYEKAKRNIAYQGIAFKNMKQHLMRSGRYEEYSAEYEEFRGFHERVMLFAIDHSGLSANEKYKLKKQCCRDFDNASPGQLRDDEMFFTQHFVEQTPELEKIRSAIVKDDTEIVSFDVFDTVIGREIWQPADLFEFMNAKFKEITGLGGEFADIRLNAETAARKRLSRSDDFREEIKLDDIYQVIAEKVMLTEDLTEELKEEELRLEELVSKRREIGYDLYRLALRCGKTVIFTSDMYLDAEFIKSLLHKNGYTEYEKLYVSSNCGVTKSGGKMYSLILKDFSVKDAGSVVHIGDNFQADFQRGQSMGLTTFWLPKPQDVFCNFTGRLTYSGQAFNSIYNDLSSLDHDIGLRTQLSIIAQTEFDNPFVRFSPLTDFNADPYYMGLFAAGPAVTAVCQWLHENLNSRGRRLVIVGDELKCFYKYIQEVIEEEGREHSIEFRPIEDNPASLPPIWSKDGLLKLSTMHSFIDFTKWTPMELANELGESFRDGFLDDINSDFAQKGILPDVNFADNVQVDAVLRILSDYLDEVKCEKIKSRHAIDSDVFVSGTNNTGTVYMTLCSEEKSGQYSVFPIPDREGGGETYCFLSANRDVLFRRIFYLLFRNPANGTTGESVIIRTFEKGIADYAAKHRRLNALLHFQNGNAISFEHLYYLIRHCGVLDTYILLPSYYDPKELRNDILWQQYVLRNNSNPHNGTVGLPSYENMKRYQKIAYLLLFDRQTFKAKVSDRLKDRPIQLHIFNATYSFARGVRNLLFGRKKE